MRAGLTQPYHLPPELVYEILYHTVYSANEFRRRLEYDDQFAPHHPFVARQASFKRSVLLVNAAWYHVGIALLWRSLVIRSPHSLAEVVSQAQRGALHVPAHDLRNKTRRIQVTISEAYQVDLVVELLTLINDLRVLVWRCRHYGSATIGC